VTCIQVPAVSPFIAALEAEKSVDNIYGKNIISRVLRVSEISKEEFLYIQAA
jgi:hypothetical protein